MENFENVPADAQHVLRVRPSANSGEAMQEIIAHGTTPDLGGCWNDEDEFDPMPYLANKRGWLPLTVSAKMTVTLGDKVYEIRRLK